MSIHFSRPEGQLREILLGPAQQSQACFDMYCGPGEAGSAAAEAAGSAARAGPGDAQPAHATADWGQADAHVHAIACRDALYAQAGLDSQPRVR